MFRKMKLAPSSACDCGLEDQTAEHNTAEMPASAESNNKRVVSSSPATHQTLRQQRGTGEDGHIRLVDWTLSIRQLLVSSAQSQVRVCIFLFKKIRKKEEENVYKIYVCGVMTVFLYSCFLLLLLLLFVCLFVVCCCF